MEHIKQIAVKTEIYVKEKLLNDHTGHDWSHTNRVRNMAIKIAEEEHANKTIVELSALLHDVCDHKTCNNQAQCYKGIQEFLNLIGMEIKTIRRILLIIQNISYKGSNVKEDALCIEGKIVQDADRLDAIGAIGIARAFIFGGANNEKIFDPELKPVFHNSFEEYKNSQSTTINHFYEKLLLLKRRLHTDAAKLIAEGRHNYMEQFLAQFYKEWNGEL